MEGLGARGEERGGSENKGKNQIKLFRGMILQKGKVRVIINHVSNKKNYCAEFGPSF